MKYKKILPPKENRPLKTKVNAQKALSDAQQQVVTGYSSGDYSLSKYMAYMQMVTFKFPPQRL